MVRRTEPKTVDPYFGKIAFDEYVIHTQTTNISFVKMFRHLKEAGVKNNKFFLRLYDPTLAKVDPHSKRLTKDQKARVVAECVKNPWYFLREVARIPAPGQALKFELHRGNLAAVWAILNNFNPILLLPRQKGKTMSVAAILSWIYDFGTTNSQMLFSNKSVNDATNRKPPAANSRAEASTSIPVKRASRWRYWNTGRPSSTSPTRTTSSRSSTRSATTPSRRPAPRTATRPLTNKVGPF